MDCSDAACGERASIVEFDHLELGGGVDSTGAEEGGGDRVSEALVRCARNGIGGDDGRLSENLPAVDASRELPHVGSAVAVPAQTFQPEGVEDGSERFGVASG